MSGKPSKETQRVERGRIVETLAPLRNFSISTAARVRAAAGPPAYARRRRHIEDLHAALLHFVGEALAASGSTGDSGCARSGSARESSARSGSARESSARESSARSDSARSGDAARQSAESDPRVVKLLREVNRLIAAHNCYYPIEANLPLDPATRLQLDHGRPWQPLPPITLDDVIAACGAAEHVGKMT